MSTASKWSSVDDLTAKQAEHDRLRRIAFVAVVISTTSLFVAVVSMPIIYGYISELQSRIRIDLSYCRFKSHTLWTEVYAIQSVSKRHVQPINNTTTRQKRMWMFGKWSQEQNQGHVSGYKPVPPPASHQLNVQDLYSNRFEPQPPAFGYELATTPVHEFQSTCCTCQTGPIGDPGEVGDDGETGLDGVNGLHGSPGRDGQILASSLPPVEPCIICPPGPVGLQGPVGLKGPRGLPGVAGKIGIDGKIGECGLIGASGPQGFQGPIGPAGIKGERGKIIEVEGPVGPSGIKGAVGDRGPKGQKGSSGISGPNGKIGPAGDKGAPGPSGQNAVKGQKGDSGTQGFDGDCSHCTTPRLSPGY